jgi:hypothetical protein
MPPRPFLEIASWVAGIASAIIAIVVWLKPSASEQAPIAQKSQQIAPAPSPNGGVGEPPAQVGASPPVRSPNTRWSCEGVASDLQPAFVAAQNIYYTGPRDEAYLSLARKALCLENYPMFDEVAKKIYYTAQRDQVYGDAVDFALNVRKFELAENFAKKIYYTAQRDAARARVVARASAR